MAQLLRLGAMAEAVRVAYDLEITADGEHARLSSYGHDGAAIGDDRPYEILKARFNGLRTAADAVLAGAGRGELTAGERLRAELDLASDRLDISFA